MIDPAFEIALETKGHDEIERYMAIVEKQEEENEQFKKKKGEPGNSTNFEAADHAAPPLWGCANPEHKS